MFIYLNQPRIKWSPKYLFATLKANIICPKLTIKLYGHIIIICPKMAHIMKVLYHDSIEYKALKRIKKIRGNVVLRQDLTDLGSYRQISRVFKKLVDTNMLIKIGSGIYAKASFNEMLNRPIIKGGFSEICTEVLDRKGIKWEYGTAIQEYNAGLTTQVPCRIVVKLKTRYRGKISYNKQRLRVEKGVNAR